jgi:5-methyltetrahydropteroyltriglutamate--homocysteine methyltransferase
VTILAWSFVRDDQPLAHTAYQVALAVRDEAVDLQSAGIAIIQIDEPALRELLPLRSRDKTVYLAWAVGAFRLATSGVSDATQIHTHLCYSEFGEVIGAIADLDADVTLIEATRSRMEILDDLTDGRICQRRGPWCLRHPLAASPDHRRDRRVATVGTESRSAATVVGQSGLWLEDPHRRRGHRVAA